MAQEPMYIPDMREYARLREPTRTEPEDDYFNDDDPLLPYTSHSGSGGGALPLVMNWKKAWDTWFKKGFTFESARVNHNFTREERAKLNNVESIDYLAPNSAAYRKWLARQPHRRQWDRWVMMGAIGVAVGFTANLLYLVINMVANFKYGITRWLISHVHLAVAWLFNVIVSTGLVFAASAVAVGWAPEAIGSGIPEVMAYLNGCQLPKVFNIFTLVVKFVSCALAVGSGMPVGPEGPLIHIGAGLGSALSQGHSTTLGFNVPLFRRFRNPKDKRNFVTAGVSVGVAAAFNAPIGGLLFAFEEVASFWHHTLGWQVFFACMCAVLTLNLFRSAGLAMLGRGQFGLFDKQVAFEVATSFSGHVLAIVPAACIGLAAGLAAIVFTAANLKLARLRDELSRNLRWRRCIEPCVLCVLWITGSMVLPLFFPCTPAECQMTNGDIKCASGLSGSSAVDTLSSSAPTLPLYTCRVVTHPANSTAGGSAIPWHPHGSSIMPDLPGNSTETVYYNQLATLLFSTGEESIKLLVSRQTHRWFGYHALFAMGCYYFIGAMLFSGAAISSGLFVPMLMLGAILGRIFGLATVDAAISLGKSFAMGADELGAWAWIDPGAFALVGAGAFMGGVTRLTVALAVIMVEISGDVHMLLPVLVAIMVAKWVADSITHSLYHGLLEVKCVPFLPHEPASKYSLDLVPVSQVMRAPAVTLRQQMKVKEITDLLRGVSHNGFPVVKDTPNGQVCIGLIARGHLLAVLQHIIVSGLSDGSEVSWAELDRKMMDPVRANQTVQEQQMVALARAMSISLDASNSAANGSASNTDHANGHDGNLGPDTGLLLAETVLDLMPYTNTSAVMVPDTFSIERTYILFRTLGLRHLIVVDEHNHVRGMVTRKDLLGYRLDDAVGRALSNHVRTHQNSNGISRRPTPTEPLLGPRTAAQPRQDLRFTL